VVFDLQAQLDQPADRLLSRRQIWLAPPPGVDHRNSRSTQSEADVNFGRISVAAFCEDAKFGGTGLRHDCNFPQALANWSSFRPT
jgi:hypothetical protein